MTISDPTFYALTNDIFEAEGKHFITIWMKAAYVSGEACLNSPREMSEVGWFSWQILPEPLFLPMQNLLAGRSIIQFS